MPEAKRRREASNDATDSEDCVQISIVGYERDDRRNVRPERQRMLQLGAVHCSNRWLPANENVLTRIVATEITESTEIQKLQSLGALCGLGGKINHAGIILPLRPVNSLP